MARDSINLIRQCKSVLLEAHAVACSRCQPPSLRLPSRLAHSGHPSKALTALTTRRFSSFRVPDLHANRAARSVEERAKIREELSEETGEEVSEEDRKPTTHGGLTDAGGRGAKDPSEDS